MNGKMMINEKYTLSIKEAAQYFSIGVKKNGRSRVCRKRTGEDFRKNSRTGKQDHTENV